MAKGIAEADIKPRENVFTFQAWKALGRSVKRGEHGVRVVTFITCTGKSDVDEAEAKPTTYCRPHATTVFHISQTEPTTERLAALGSGPLDWPRQKRLRQARKVARLARRDPGYVDPGELAEDRWNETH